MLCSDTESNTKGIRMRHASNHLWDIYFVRNEVIL